MAWDINIIISNNIIPNLKHTPYAGDEFYTIVSKKYIHVGTITSMAKQGGTGDL